MEMDKIQTELKTIQALLNPKKSGNELDKIVKDIVGELKGMKSFSDNYISAFKSFSSEIDNVIKILSSRGEDLEYKQEVLEDLSDFYDSTIKKSFNSGSKMIDNSFKKFTKFIK